MPTFPLEIIILILSRLPLKPLLKFKCVCKSWHSLISSDPYFAELQLEYAKRDPYLNPHGLLLSTDLLQSIDLEAYCNGDDYSIVARRLSYPVRTSRTDVKFVGSCDGLVSLVFDSNPLVIVWNPSTGDTRELPPGRSFPAGRLFFGFGYDPRLHDYKIVRGVVTSAQVEMEIFALKGNTWRALQGLHCSDAFWGLATSVNAVLYWLVRQKNDQDITFLLLSFDLVKEKFLKMVQVPSHIHQGWRDELNVFADCLSLSPMSNGPNYYEAWILKDFGNKDSWSRLVNFNSDLLSGCKYYLQLLWVSESGNVLLNLDGRELVLYNQKEETVERFRVANDWNWYTSTTYIESLVSPNPPGAAEGQI